MIIDSIDNMYRYIGAVPQLSTVIETLRRVDFSTLPVGQYKTANPLVRYNVMEFDIDSTEPVKQEIHEKEIDVQIDISGAERFVTSFREGEVTEAYDGERDAAFQKVDERVVFTGDPGMFAIFFPGEPHTSLLRVGEKNYHLKKCVFKLIY